MSLLITNATVLTVDAEDRVIKDGAVLVEDGRIAAVGTSDEVKATHPGAARVIDGGGKVVLPQGKITKNFSESMSYCESDVDFSDKAISIHRHAWG